MPIELKVPEVGESITEVEIADWLKSEGDAVAKDENVVSVESEKASVELPAPASGRLTKILKQKGQKASVGEVIAQIEKDDQPAAASKEKPKSGGKAEKKSQPEEEKKQAEEKKKQSADKKQSEPEAPPTSRKDGQRQVETEETAEESEQPPAEEPAPASRTREKPRIIQAQREPDEPTSEAREAKKSSTESAKPARQTQPQPVGADREEEKVTMSLLRRTVAKRLVEAQQTMAMLTTFNEIDMSAVVSLRKEHQEAFQKKYQTKLGFMSFFVKAVIDALKLVPQLNAEVRGDDIVFRNYYDIGMAIGSERGLVVPVLRNAERLSFAEIEKAIGDFATRAKENKLKIEELQGGTFTITNGGVYGSLLSTPIINPPQSGILGMHTIQDRPVAVDGAVAIRPMMYVALSYDHRIVDGREAVTFLKRVKEAIETPARMLLEV
jgi:2-oxoglutarate dehydrogenase E2 component (dihydrolipoamide succinyltransferase)